MARRDGQKWMASEWLARRGRPERNGQQGFIKNGWPDRDCKKAGHERIATGWFDQKNLTKRVSPGGLDQRV